MPDHNRSSNPATSHHIYVHVTLIPVTVLQIKTLNHVQNYHILTIY